MKVFYTSHRGMDLNYDRWVYGSLVPAIVGKGTPNVQGEAKIVKCEDGVFYSHPVAWESVGMFTGYEDENGECIYVGDIVYCRTESTFRSGGREKEVTKEEIYVVVQHLDGFHFSLSEHIEGYKDIHNNEIELVEFGEIGKMLVIGNVYDFKSSGVDYDELSSFMEEYNDYGYIWEELKTLPNKAKN